MKIPTLKLSDRAHLMTRASDQSAGLDIYACTDFDILIYPQQTVMVKTGLAMQLPENTVGLIFARSGLATKKGLAPANKVGVIDSDYRGEIMVPLFNHSDLIQVVSHHERIAQMVIMPYLKCECEEVIRLDVTQRADKGFGSSGS